MASTFTSRFRRREEKDARSAASVPEGAGSDAAIVARGEEWVEAAERAAATQPDALKSDIAEADRPAVPPSRLIEIERPKPAPVEQPQAKTPPGWLRAYRLPAAAAATLIVALGMGYGFGAVGQDKRSGAKSAQMLEKTSRDLREAHSQIGQLTAELKSIKTAVDGIKGDREKSRNDILSKQAQLSERLDKTGQESASRIGRIAEQLDRVEKSQRDAVRQASLEKPDKADKHDKVAAAPAQPVPVPPVKPALDVAHTGSIGEAKPAAEKPDPRKTLLDGYVVRDYDQGYALIETRSGRHYDVAVGYNLPGIGKVEAIERRGRQWVVVTQKGYIVER